MHQADIPMVEATPVLDVHCVPRDDVYARPPPMNPYYAGPAPEQRPPPPRPASHGIEQDPPQPPSSAQSQRHRRRKWRWALALAVAVAVVAAVVVAMVMVHVGRRPRARANTPGLTRASQEYWMSVTYGNRLFVAVAEDHGVMTSPDGLDGPAALRPRTTSGRASRTVAGSSSPSQGVAPATA